MSIFPKETVTGIAESIGITLKDDIANLLIQDTEYRTREIIIDAAKFARHSKRRKLLPRDINSALQVKNVQKLYGYHNVKDFIRTANLYYLEDEEVDLEELVNRPLPPIPCEPTYTAHWLAIEGIQPRIVQNPTLSDLAEVTSVEGEKDEAPKDAGVKQVLTKELQLYYEKITTLLFQSTYELAIESISNDPGIQALMPYFCNFISEKVTMSLKDLHTLKQVMLMIKALFRNERLFLDPYLHQMLPAIITCVVAKSLGQSAIEINDDGITREYTHFELRRYASILLNEIVDSSKTTYQTLHKRIIKTLTRALLDPGRTIDTIYGTLYALKTMGPEVIELLIVPHYDSLIERVNEEITAAETLSLLLQIKKISEESQDLQK